MQHFLLAFTACSLFLLGSCQPQESQEQVLSSSPADQAAPGALAQGSEPYPLETCPVSGEALGSMGGAIEHQEPGRELRFCCESCVGAYEADSESYNAAIDSQIVALQKPDYPLETCLVSGNVIGASEHMVPIDHVAGNRLYRLCCDSCVKSLEKDLPKYRAELIAAAK